jgi:hypothetical protein
MNSSSVIIKLIAQADIEGAGRALQAPRFALPSEKQRHAGQQAGGRRYPFVSERFGEIIFNASTLRGSIAFACRCKSSQAGIKIAAVFRLSRNTSRPDRHECDLVLH